MSQQSNINLIYELVKRYKNIPVDNLDKKAISSNNEKVSIGEIYANYVLGEFSLTAGEFSIIKTELISLLDFSNDQFEIFNACLRQRSSNYDNNRLSYRQLNIDQLNYLENILYFMEKKVAIFKEIGEQGILGKCKDCKTRMGFDKTIFSTENHANMYIKYLKEKLGHFQAVYKCPSQNGWHLKSHKHDDFVN